MVLIAVGKVLSLIGFEFTLKRCQARSQKGQWFLPVPDFTTSVTHFANSYDRTITSIVRMPLIANGAQPFSESWLRAWFECNAWFGRECNEDEFDVQCECKTCTIDEGAWNVLQCIENVIQTGNPV